MKATFEIVGRKNPAYRILPETGRRVLEDNWQNGIKCLLCYKVSWSPRDVVDKYCSNCGFFHSNDWAKDKLITHRRKTDNKFAAKLIRAVLLYDLHKRAVDTMESIWRACRSVKRFFLPPKKV